MSPKMSFASWISSIVFLLIFVDLSIGEDQPANRDDGGKNNNNNGSRSEKNDQVGGQNLQSRFLNLGSAKKGPNFGGDRHFHRRPQGSINSALHGITSLFHAGPHRNRRVRGCHCIPFYLCKYGVFQYDGPRNINSRSAQPNHQSVVNNDREELTNTQGIYNKSNTLARSTHRDQNVNLKNAHSSIPLIYSTQESTVQSQFRLPTKFPTKDRGTGEGGQSSTHPKMFRKNENVPRNAPEISQRLFGLSSQCGILKTCCRVVPSSAVHLDYNMDDSSVDRNLR